MKTLRSSQRKGIKGDKVTYSIRPSSGEKYKRKPHTEAWRAGGYATLPRKVK